MRNERSGPPAEVTGFRLAAVFDRVDPVTGPAFAAGHPVITDAGLADLLVRRLHAGALVLVTPTLMNDVIDPSRGAVVPMSYRTDGVWIWTDTVTYYLEQHGLVPAPALTEHLLHGDGAPWDVNHETVAAAASFVLSPPATAEPVWMPG